MSHPAETSPTSKRLELVLLPVQVGTEFVRHACILRRIDGSDHLDSTLWYEVPVQLPQIATDDAEPFLLAAIMDAMQEGRSVHVGGRVSFQLLSNLHEYMVAWSRWLPDTFQVVDISAQTISTFPDPTELAPDSAVTAHTGGVDAMFTILRHTQALEGHRTRKITACVVVHGFLIALDQHAKFATSIQLAQRSLDALGLVAHPLRTNYREVIRTYWGHVYGIAMISVLQFFKPMGRSCLVNAPKPYDDLLFPRGSNPLTDALLSSDSLQVLHDGTGFDRLEKVAAISKWQDGTRHLRVCWHGKQIEPHCGKCEECLRTKLGYLALGERFPDSMGSIPTGWEVLELEAFSHASRVDFERILAHCREHKVQAPWVRALWFRLRFEKTSIRLVHWKWRILHMLGKA